MLDDEVTTAGEVEVEAPVEPTTETQVETSAPVETPTEAPVEPEAKPEPADWRAARLAKQSAQIKELREKLEAFQKNPAPEIVPKDDIERLANERAQQIAAQAAFNARCDAVANAGRKAFPDFEAKVQNLVQLIDRNDPESIGAYNRFLEIAIDTGEGEKLIHQLGSVPNEAARLMGLSPVKMAMEMAKLASAPAAQATGAPKPITPVGGRTASHESIDPNDPERADKISTRVWMERREAYLAKQQRA